jgi:hypothetical protein
MRNRPLQKDRNKAGLHAKALMTSQVEVSREGWRMRAWTTQITSKAKGLVLVMSVIIAHDIAKGRKGLENRWTYRPR